MLVLIEFHSQVLGLHSLLKTIQWNLQINKGRIGIWDQVLRFFRGYKCILSMQKQAFGTTKFSPLMA